MAIATKTRTGKNLLRAPVQFRVLEEAREAVYRLRALRPLLTPEDEETLTILMDKELIRHLEKSLREEANGDLEPLGNIWK